MKKKLELEDLKDFLSNKFFLKNFVKESVQETQFINTVDDTIQYINDSENNITFIAITSLENFLFDMIDRKYTPSVCVTNGVSQYIDFKVDDRSFTIQSGDDSL